MDTLRHVRLIGDRAPQGLLETLLEICAQAGGAKKLVTESAPAQSYYPSKQVRKPGLL